MKFHQLIETNFEKNHGKWSQKKVETISKNPESSLDNFVQEMA